MYIIVVILSGLLFRLSLFHCLLFFDCIISAMKERDRILKPSFSHIRSEGRMLNNRIEAPSMSSTSAPKRIPLYPQPQARRPPGPEPSPSPTRSRSRMRARTRARLHSPALACAASSAPRPGTCPAKARSRAQPLLRERLCHNTLWRGQR